MTTEHEQLRALKNINRWLIELVDIRKRDDRRELVRRLLRHYPCDSEIERKWDKEARCNTQ